MGGSPVINQWLTHLPQLKGYIKVFPNEGHFIEVEEPKYIAETIMEVLKLK